MTNQTLAERLQDRFGGKVECQWGVPADKYLAAYLTEVRTEPKQNEITDLITQYFANHGFKKIEGLGGLTFEDSQHKNQRISCYTYSDKLEKLIVSAAEF